MPEELHLPSSCDKALPTPSLRWLAAMAETPIARDSNPCSDLVNQAERLALANLDEPLHIAALCRTLEVSERTLRKAFHKTHGIPPCRHLRLSRLSQARRALSSADCRFMTVTEVATSFGFLELGRFSVEYRKHFGESPSQTLHRGAPDRSPPVNDAVHDSPSVGV
ncbi:helix-turn-helix domain-containing protein [Bradyrhizobium sp. McL0616]|uniref:helix-turn-helix domain-containing protein n=1 Tax=Bradyrhizobium sp. McL0616 TaxID=3415674 RepID=UPI003CF5B4D8